MDNIMGFIDTLCQALQCNSQDILNALKLVSSTKNLLQKFREDYWDIFLANVVLFCNRYNIDIPDLSSRYVELMELEHRFNNEVVELLTLSSALDPSDSFKYFNVEKICNLAEKFYPWDFTVQDVKTLKFQLMHYQLDVSTITERVFSSMKRVETAMRSRIGDAFLADCMTINLERELVWKIDLEPVIDEFKSLKTRRAQLR
ncbi:uncharacterized protein LOC132296492 [Cornus florida]|uniref:uncharacterized protein LOC132296492 n=1 Tax=Cornus florida TaxID=4283 RepID=UPI002898096C|nr:uncharacterized protein LOC132296492 [Cornus florida]